jgi:hypothetical protein
MTGPITFIIQKYHSSLIHTMPFLSLKSARVYDTVGDHLRGFQHVFRYYAFVTCWTEPILVASLSKVNVSGYWDRGFESRTENGCLSLVLSCVGRGLCDGLITRPEEFYRVSLYVWSQKPRKGPYAPVGNYRKMSEWMTCWTESGN